VHEALLAAVARRLGIKDARKLPPGAVSLVRKSFDARPKLPEKHWVYVVDVRGAVLRGVGAQVRCLSCFALRRLLPVLVQCCGRSAAPWMRKACTALAQPCPFVRVSAHAGPSAPS
jgi:hypothetical protein